VKGPYHFSNVLYSVLLPPGAHIGPILQTFEKAGLFFSFGATPNMLRIDSKYIFGNYFDRDHFSKDRMIIGLV
jgi:hypothetical protein